MAHMNMGSMPLMPGMLTPQQMMALEQARGASFDHLFLTGMIQHHTGALVMVQDLFNTPGAGQDAVLFDFATDIDNTQRAEIEHYAEHAAQGEKMIRTFTSLAVSALFPILCLAQTKASAPATVYSNPRASTDDPRVGLKAGLYDAGEAIFGLEKLASLPKPPGFAPGNFIPNLQPPPPPDEPLKPGEPPHAPAGTYGSANSDLAFSGNHVFVGNYNGINFYDIDNPAKVKLTASLVCPGGQGDVSVYGHLLFMSAEAVNARLDCGTQGVPLPAGYVPPPPPPPAPVIPGVEPEHKYPPLPPPNPDRFRGVRIFDISNLSNPRQVAAVQTCRGSHTHTLVIDPNDKDNVYIYVSGTGNVRQAEELAGCVPGDKENPNPEHFLVQHRYHPGAASPSGVGKDRFQPSHLHRRAERSDQWAVETRQPRRRHPDYGRHG